MVRRRPYTCLSRAIGCFLSKLKHSELITQRRNNESAALSDLLNQSFILISNEPKSFIVCEISIAYLRHGFDLLLSHMEAKRYVFPVILESVPVVLTLLTSGQVTAEFAFLDGYLDLFKLIVAETLSDIHDLRICHRDVTIVKSELRNITSTAKAFDLDVNAISLTNLETDFKEAYIALKALDNTINFLNNHKLCPDFAALRARLSKANNDDTPYSDILRACDEVTLALHLSTYALNALKLLSCDSDLFVDRFDSFDDRNTRTLVGISGRDISAHIEELTKYTLDHLQELVLDDNIKISNFATSIYGIVSELKQYGNNRHRKLEKELQVISDYFMREFSVPGSSQKKPSGKRKYVRLDSANSISDKLARLSAACSLIQIREILPAFFVALNGLGLPHLAASMPPNLWASLQSDFLISEAPDMLQEVRDSLGSLTFYHMKIISKLATEQELSAGLLLMFLKRYSQQDAFDTVMEHSLNRAASNPHASQILLKIPPVRELLKPLYHRIEEQTLASIRDHFTEHVKVSNEDSQSAVCLSLEELENLIENWADCEIYFSDGAATGDTGDIIRRVTLYLKTGVFEAFLRAHSNGASLVFSYQSSNGRALTLSSDVLQEHVQWAVFGSDNSEDNPCLQEFVYAYHEALKAHSALLELEAIGHPDYHANAFPKGVPLAGSHVDIRATAEVYMNEKNQWLEFVREACEKCPRLHLLSKKNRVNLLLAVKQYLVNPSPNVLLSLLSYTIMCFPTSLAARAMINNSLQAVLSTQQVVSASPLDGVVQLLRDVEHQLAPPPIDSEGTVSSVMLDGAFLKDLYIHLLKGMLSDNAGLPCLPAAVLWGHESLSSDSIQDFLLAISSGVCPSAHVLLVDKILPRMREELLRGLLTVPITCPVTLIFGSQTGFDAFRHYQVDSEADLDSKVDTATIKLMARSFWPLFARPGVKDIEFELTVWAVTGAAGSGKSTWINAKIDEVSAALMEEASRHRFVVHEGFSAALVLDTLSALMRDHMTLFIHFDVTVFADLFAFHKFIHNLHVLGMYTRIYIYCAST